MHALRDEILEAIETGFADMRLQGEGLRAQVQQLQQEVIRMSETLDQAQANEATALQNLTTQVANIGAAQQASSAEIQSLLGKLAAGQSVTPAEIAAAQATADGINAQANALAAMAAPPASSTGTTSSSTSTATKAAS